MKKIGITTTIPVEIVFSANMIPVDLNNIFITSQNPGELVRNAEYEGYPRNSCGWIKGIYSSIKNKEVDALIAVVAGDCSQTQAMIETLNGDIEIIPFEYPYTRDKNQLKKQFENLINSLNTTWDNVLIWQKRLDKIRAKVWELDRLTWQENAIKSFDNHYYQVCCSDFNSDPEKFEKELDEKLDNTHNKYDDGIRLGYIGVPPIYTDIYSFIESLGARVVFNEVQRQFSLPYKTDDILEKYLLYTYPYDVQGRIADIKNEIEKRNLHGIIHYTQSFCFRQILDIVIRKNIDIPILTIEGDSPSPLDARTKLRIESFLEMLR
ncbi:MAG: 2-hydroxyacyl-CoA dehydratase family protein [Armatimonadota bacterium]